MSGFARLGLRSLLGAGCFLSLLFFDRGAFQTFREPKFLVIVWIAGACLLLWGLWLISEAFRRRTLPLPPAPVIALIPFIGLIGYQFQRAYQTSSPTSFGSEGAPLQVEYFIHILLPAVAWLVLFCVASLTLRSGRNQRAFLAILCMAFTLEVSVVLLEIVQNQTGLQVNPVVLLTQGEIDVFGQSVKERIFGTIGNPNWVAGYLAIAIFPLIGWLLVVRSRLPRVILVLVLAAGTFALVSTRSKGAFLALMVGAVHFGVTFLLLRRKRRVKNATAKKSLSRPAWIVAGLLALALAGGFVIANQSPAGENSSYLDHWAETLALRGDSVTVRALLAHCGFQMWREDPWVGLGAGEFKIQFLDTLRDLVEGPEGEKFKVRVARLHSLRATHLHNEYLQTLVEFGVLGLLIVELFFVWCQCRAYRFILGSENNGDSILRIGFLSGVWAGFGGSLFDYPFHRPAQVFLLAVLLGIAIALPNRWEKGETARPRGLWLSGIGILLGVALAVVSVFLMWQANAKYVAQRLGFWGKTSLEIAGGDPGRAYQALATAQDLVPGEGEYTLWLAYYYLAAKGDPNLAIRQIRRARETSDNPNRVMLEATAQLQRNDYLTAGQLLQFVGILEPNKVGLQFLKGRLFEKQQRWKEAARAYLAEIQNSRRTGERSPHLEESYLHLAGILEKQLGQYEEAARYYKGFLETLGDRKPTYPEARLRLGDLSLNRFYDLESAERYYNEALEILKDQGAEQDAGEVEKILEDIQNRKERFR
ncbi:MAG: O-antigen ligase family protein [Candidatus Omnitrophica bacterium]|nr:O-antigen ligase family protein [Candidatus Omnitrophota bacterium]MCB9781431.1 O-antigen ligase family protein [Candidatus Omnitrophota bacterium]